MDYLFSTVKESRDKIRRRRRTTSSTAHTMTERKGKSATILGHAVVTETCTNVGSCISNTL